MAEIKAFVAYSYSDHDKALIGIFTEHLDTLANSIPGFSWDHAKWAEPEPVSSKVLAKFEGKNVLIVICTPSEYAVAPNAVYHTPFLKIANLKPPGAVWKTSDWIIQEIGLAIGRGMKVILLLEDGVRKPGGLFGDVECIPFSRQYPQASFTRLQQMLCTPPKDPVIILVEEAKPTTSDKAKDVEEPATNSEPQPDWDQTRYNRAVFQAIVLSRDSAALAVIDTAYRQCPLSNGVALTIWEARIEFLRMIAGERSDFEKMKKAAHDYPTNGVLLYYLACGYREFGQIEAAARTYEDAAANTNDDFDKLQYLANAAFHYAQVGQWKRSREIAETLKSNVADNAGLQYILLANLQDLANAEKNDLLELAIMEQMVELRPSDFSIRFKLAYRHSKIGNSDMALYHYLKIPIFENILTAWNNLGVAFNAFDMPIKAVSAYRASEGENNTLAMCNLGFKLLGSGFLPEARAEADKALPIKPRHENVPQLLRRLDEAQEEEQGQTRRDTRKDQGEGCHLSEDGRVRPEVNSHRDIAQWKSPDGPLEAQMDGTSVRFFGTRRRPANALAGIVQGGFGQVVYTERIEYSGQVRGAAVFGQVKRVREGQAPIAFGLQNDGEKMVMTFNEDRTEIHVMERPDGLYPIFYSFTRST